jgi:hypothetical protein
VRESQVVFAPEQRGADAQQMSPGFAPQSRHWEVEMSHAMRGTAELHGAPVVQHASPKLPHERHNPAPQ